MTCYAARAAQARGSQLRHGNLWNKLWNGAISEINVLRVPPLISSTATGIPYPLDVDCSIWIDFLRSLDSLSLRRQYGTGSLRAGATYCVVPLFPPFDVKLFLPFWHFVSLRFVAYIPELMNLNLTIREYRSDVERAAHRFDVAAKS